jgi:hypothetical protein
MNDQKVQEKNFTEYFVSLDERAAQLESSNTAFETKLADLKTSFDQESKKLEDLEERVKHLD